MLFKIMVQDQIVQMLRISIIWIINTAFMFCFFSPPVLNRHYAKNQGKVKEKSCSCRIKRASVSFRETKFHISNGQYVTSRTDKISHLERALMEEQAGNGAHKRTTLGPRFKSRNHYHLLVTYQMNT